MNAYRYTMAVTLDAGADEVEPRVREACGRRDRVGLFDPVPRNGPAAARGVT